MTDTQEPRPPGAGDLTRRRFLQAAGMGAAALPALGVMAQFFNAPPAGAQLPPPGPPARSKDPWPKRPAYRFAMICHLTAEPFFVPTRLGANDACDLLGATYTWDGSASGITDEMVDAFEDAIDDKVDGIGCCMVDPKAFNDVTDKALAAGIPVVAFNAEAAPSSGNHAMAFIGQGFNAAGAAVAQRALSYVQKGDLVGAMVGTPSSLTEQSRLAGAQAVFDAAGARLAKVVVGTEQKRAVDNIASWAEGHPDAKFVFATSGINGPALAAVAARLAWPRRGVHAATFDVSMPVLMALSKGQLGFTVDQQAYLQGFLPIFELFMYSMTGGLIAPFDVSTGSRLVTRQDVGRYLLHRDSWEGTSTVPVVLRPPKTVHG